MNRLMLMMGGSGVRFGADVPKQFVEVEGLPIFVYILDEYQKCDCIDEIIIVVHKDWIEDTGSWCEKRGITKCRVITAGGSTRSESIRNGLQAIKDAAQDDDVILFHDATHPYVDEPGTEKVIEAIRTYGGATLGEMQYDTVYRMDEKSNMIQKVEPRREIVAGASPEGFLFGDIYRIYMNTSEEDFERLTSAGAVALENDIPMKVIPTTALNLKITYQYDLEVFKSQVKARQQG